MHYEIHHIKHPFIIDSFLFYHIILSMKPIASYTVMKPHFNTVRLFSQNSSFPRKFTKTSHTRSNTSTKNIHHSHMITVAYSYPHTKKIPFNSQNFTKFVSFYHFSKENHFPKQDQVIAHVYHSKPFYNS